MSFYGPAWPLKNGTDDLFEMNDSLRKEINFYLKNILLTSPGENISDPAYGVGLRRFLFESFEDGTIDLLSGRISTQINKYINFINVSRIVVDNSAANKENSILGLKIIYSIRNQATQEVFELELNPETTIGLY
tara:strand:- start:1007 stop:1408 length:402 start_codon:yes stop_codon:yes gene_type:complete